MEKMASNNMEQGREVNLNELVIKLIPEVRKRIQEAPSEDKSMFGYICKKVFDENEINVEGLLRSDLLAELGHSLKDEFNLNPSSYQIGGYKENETLLNWNERNIKKESFSNDNIILRGARINEDIEKKKNNPAYLNN